MSAISWKNPVSGNWVDASDWSGGKVPRAADAVSIGGIGATTAYGVNIIGSGNFAAESITIDDSYVTVVVWDLISVPVITLDAGNLNLINTDMGETKLVANGGALITTGGDLASISIAGTLDLIGTTTDTGAGSLSVGSLALGAGTLDNINDASVSAGTISSDGGTLWGGNNPTNCSLDGNITLVSTGGEVDDSTLAGENGSGAGTLNLVSGNGILFGNNAEAPNGEVINVSERNAEVTFLGGSLGGDTTINLTDIAGLVSIGSGTGTFDNMRLVSTSGSVGVFGIGGNWSTITLGSNFSLALGAASGSMKQGDVNSIAGFEVPSTIIDNGTIQVQAKAVLEIIGSTITNTGTIAVSESGTVSIISTVGFSDSGEVSATGSGSVLEIAAPAVTGDGAIHISNGATLELGGNYTMDGINHVSSMHIVDSGGNLALGGTITNHGTIITGAGVTCFNSVSINGGKVVDALGLLNTVMLQNVTFDGVLNGGTLSGDTTLASASGSGQGTVNLAGGDAYVSFGSAVQALFGEVINVTVSGADIVFDGDSLIGTTAIDLSGNAGRTFVDLITGKLGSMRLSSTSESLGVFNIYSQSGSLTLGQGCGLTLGAASGSAGSYTGGANYLGGTSGVSTEMIVNNGTIQVQAGALLYIDGKTVTNGGTVEVSSGGTVYIQSSDAFSNSGVISAAGAGTEIEIMAANIGGDGTLDISSGANVILDATYSISGINQIGGFVTTYSGGALALGGTITNNGTIITGSSVIGDSSAPLSITGGSVVDANGLLSVSSLQNVIFDGVLNYISIGTLSVGGDTDFSDASGNGSGTMNVTGNGASVNFASTVQAPNGEVINVSGESTSLTFGGDSLGGMTTINVSGRATSTDLIQSTGILDDMHIAVQANAALWIGAAVITNAGVIAANGGGSVSIDSNGGFTDNGVISATGAGSFVKIVSTGIAGGGAIGISQGAELVLGGTYSMTGTNDVAGINFTDNGGLISLSGSITNRGTILASAAVIGNNVYVNGGTVNDASGTFLQSGGELDNVIYQGDIAIAAGKSVTLSGTEQFSGADGSGAGTISLAGANSNLDLGEVSTSDPLTLISDCTIMVSGSGDSLIANGDSLFDNATISLESTNTFWLNGTVTLGSGATLSASGIGQLETILSTGSGTLVNNGTVQASGAGATLKFGQPQPYGGGSSINTGLMSANDGGTLAFDGGGAVVLENEGTLSASGAGSVIDFDGKSRLTNDAKGTLNAGSYVALGGGLIELGFGAAVRALGANVILSGMGSEFESAGAVTLEASLKTILAGGELTILGGRGYATQNNLVDSGTFAIAGGTFTAAGIVVAAGASLIGAGTLAAMATNDGLIDANGGTLVVTQALSGTGELQIETGATLVLDSTITAGMVANFNGASATLEFDGVNPSPAIANFSAGDQVDLAGIIATSVSTSGNFITVRESNGNSLILTLAGALSGGTLSVSSDGAGGSFITAGTGVTEAGGMIADFAGSAGVDVLSAVPDNEGASIGGGAAMMSYREADALRTYLESFGHGHVPTPYR